MVNRIKRSLKLDKIGHTGTLDPNAEGLMLVLFNNSTKANQFLVHDTKEYIASLRLGIKTDTKDIWGTLLEEQAYEMPTQGPDSGRLSDFFRHSATGSTDGFRSQSQWETAS